MGHVPCSPLRIMNSDGMRSSSRRRPGCEWQPFVKKAAAIAGLFASVREDRPLPPPPKCATPPTHFVTRTTDQRRRRKKLARPVAEDVEDWMNYLRGRLLRDRTCRLSENRRGKFVSDEEVAEVIKCHAVCAGRLGDWAVKLADERPLLEAAGSRRARLHTRTPRDLVRNRWRVRTATANIRHSKLIETK